MSNKCIGLISQNNMEPTKKKKNLVKNGQGLKSIIDYIHEVDI